MTDFSRTREFFHIPEGLVYLDGNSLGPLPRNATSRLQKLMTEEWGELLISGWNLAGWMESPARVGDKIGKLIGAPSGTVVTGETLSIRLYQALGAALSLRSNRRIVLSDTGNFPSDLYIAQGLLDTLGNDYELKLVEPDQVSSSIDDAVAVLMLTEVDYRTGRKHDMRELTRLAHDAGAITVWDLAHSAGAIEVDLSGTGADLAVGCTYKYLNGGPGSPAYIYVSDGISDHVRSPLHGWLGHASPFMFEKTYRPAVGTSRMRIGTPPVIALEILEAALEVWDLAQIRDVSYRSNELTEQFIAGVETECPDLELASPSEARHRGSQVSFRHPEGFSIIRALSERGVVGDFREPDILRFGFAPLYNGEQDVQSAIRLLAMTVASSPWKDTRYRVRTTVT